MSIFRIDIELDGRTLIRIANCLKKHENEIYLKFKSEFKETLKILHAQHESQSVNGNEPSKEVCPNCKAGEEDIMAHLNPKFCANCGYEWQTG